MFQRLSDAQMQKLIKKNTELKKQKQDEVTAQKTGVILAEQEAEKATAPITKLLQEGLFREVEKLDERGIIQKEIRPLLTIIEDQFIDQGVNKTNIRSILKNIENNSSTNIDVLNTLKSELEKNNVSQEDQTNFLFLIANQIPDEESVKVIKTKLEEDLQTVKLQQNLLNDKLKDGLESENILEELNEKNERLVDLIKFRKDIDEIKKSILEEIDDEIDNAEERFNEQKDIINNLKKERAKKTSDKKVRVLTTKINKETNLLNKLNSEIISLKNEKKNIDKHEDVINMIEEFKDIHEEIYGTRKFITASTLKTNKRAQRLNEDIEKNKAIFDEYKDNSPHYEQTIANLTIDERTLESRIKQLEDILEKGQFAEPELLEEGLIKGKKGQKAQGIISVKESKPIPRQPKNNPYKIIDNQFGDLFIDERQLKAFNKLRVKKGGQVLFNEIVSNDLVDLLTKRFNSRRNYDVNAVQLFNELVNKANLPVNRNSQKFKLAQQTGNGKVDIKIFSSNKDLINRMAAIIAAMNAGNTSLLLRNEMRQIIDKLLGNNIIKKDEHKHLTNRFRL